MNAKFEEMVPRPAAGFDWKNATLSAQEGFVLSRIDGRSTVHDLSLVLSLPLADIVTLLRKLQHVGAIEPLQFTERAARALPRSQLKQDVPIEERIAEMRRVALTGDHYAVLGVGVSATEAEIRRAFFRLSKRFHPDVYYGRHLGDAEEALFDVYEAIRTAYEVLSDGQRRPVFDKQRRAADPAESERLAREKAIEERRAQILAERRDKQNPFAKRVKNGAALLEEGRAAFDRGDFEEAVRTFKMAAVMDPANAVYGPWVETATAKRDELRVRPLLEAARAAERDGRIFDAGQHRVDAAKKVPGNPVEAARAVQFCLEHDVDPEGLESVARRAAELRASSPQFLYLLGAVLERKADLGGAMEQYDAALAAGPHPAAEERLRVLRGGRG